MRARDGAPVRVFASHLTTSTPGGGTATVVLAVPAEHRPVLESAAPPAGPTPDQLVRAEQLDEAPLAVREDVAARLGLDELLQRTVERARDALDGDAAYVLLATELDEELELRATTGLPPGLYRSTRVPAEFGGTAVVASGHLPAVHGDLDADHAGVAFLRGTGLRSLVTVPMLVEGGVIGTIGVASTLPGRFDNDDAVRLQRAADRVVLSVQSARLTDLERQRRGALSFIAEASDLLAGSLDQDMTVALVAQLVVPRLGEWCVIHLIDDLGAPRPASVWHAREDRIDDLRALMDKVPPPQPRARPGVRAWDLDSDLTIAGTPLARAEDLLRSEAVSVPLVARGRALGTLAVGRSGGEGFRRDAFPLLEDLGRRAALALDNARLYRERTAIAQALQASLLPPELPDTPGLDVAVVYEAAGAGNEVGGDFYDVFELGKGRWGFAVGDVCGKGPEAAAVTGLARHALRMLGRKGDPVDDVLRQLNAAILDEGPRARFLTLVYGEIAREGDGAAVRFASAGHPLPLRLNGSGAVVAEGRSGSLLGVLDEVDVAVNELTLAAGESLVCFTDGVLERRDGARMLGEDGVVQALRGCGDLPADAVAKRLHRTVVAFADEAPRDDMAVLVVRVG